jgi:SpoIID/LytB domain protein
LRLFVGLTTSDLSGLLHDKASVSCAGSASVWSMPIADLLNDPPSKAATSLFDLAPQEVLSVTAAGDHLKFTHKTQTTLKPDFMLRIAPTAASSALCFNSVSRAGNKAGSPRYHGRFFIIPAADKVRVVLETDLESYIKGVLQSEIPASFHIEAIKAQAVTARTYALHPRIDHSNDSCNVCDSYLCCQYFAGLQTISYQHEQAIVATAGQVVTYQNQPILALFSSCAGGHTESYENCFSDPKTGAFPPSALPYLVGVPEGKLPPGYSDQGAPTEQAMRSLWAMPHPQTVDGDASQFRWSAHVPAQDLESHMHHVVQRMRATPDTAPFVIAPDSSQFGHIKSFNITKRGVAGTAIEMSIDTSTGVWKVKKELVIRSCFKLPDLKIARLRSARIFFDHHYDNLGLLSAVDIHGLGFGHGVGLQQTGAQGLAKQGSNYRQIIAHYFHKAEVSNI